MLRWAHTMLRQPLIVKNNVRNLTSELISKFGTDEQKTQFFNTSPVIYNILSIIHNLATVFSQLKKNLNQHQYFWMRDKVSYAFSFKLFAKIYLFSSLALGKNIFWDYRWKMKQNVKPSPWKVKLVVLKAPVLLQFLCFEFTFLHLHTKGQK